MDVLNKALAQINDLFKSMTPGARLTAGLLLCVVVVSLAYLFNHQMSGGDSDLLGGQPFTAGEMSSMEAAFGKAGLNGYTVVGNRIRVPAGQKAAYMAALVDHGALPAHFGDYLGNAMDKVNAFTSRQQQEEMLKIAKQRELTSIILSMQGIDKASVQYDVQKKTGFRQSSLASASVSVKRYGMLPLEEKQVPMIRALVAGAFAGLAPEDVSVIDLNGRTYSRRSGDGLSSALEDPFVTRMREYQAMYEAQIHNALSYVPGVTVTANVELNKELSTKQESEKFDPKQVAVLRQVEESTNNTTEPANPGGGRPGLEAQGPNQPARLAAGGGGTKSTEDHSTTEVQNAPSHDRTLTELAGLTPRRVSAVIGVPTSYFEQVWRQRNPPAAGEAPKTPDKGGARRHYAGRNRKAAHVRQQLASATASGADNTAAPGHGDVLRPCGHGNGYWSAAGRQGRGLARELLDYAGHHRPGTGKPDDAPVADERASGRGVRPAGDSAASGGGDSGRGIELQFAVRRWTEIEITLAPKTGCRIEPARRID